MKKVFLTLILLVIVCCGFVLATTNVELVNTNPIPRGTAVPMELRITGDASNVMKVNLYFISTDQERLIGSAERAPYIIYWDTINRPANEERDGEGDWAKGYPEGGYRLRAEVVLNDGSTVKTGDRDMYVLLGPKPLPYSMSISITHPFNNSNVSVGMLPKVQLTGLSNGEAQPLITYTMTDEQTNSTKKDLSYISFSQLNAENRPYLLRAIAVSSAGGKNVTAISTPTKFFVNNDPDLDSWRCLNNSINKNVTLHVGETRLQLMKNQHGNATLPGIIGPPPNTYDVSVACISQDEKIKVIISGRTGLPWLSVGQTIIWDGGNLSIDAVQDIPKQPVTSQNIFARFFRWIRQLI